MDIYRKYKTSDFNLNGSEVRKLRTLVGVVGKRDFRMSFKGNNCIYFGREANRLKVKNMFQEYLLSLSVGLRCVDKRYLNLVHLEVSEIKSGGYVMNLCFTLKQGGYETERICFDKNYNILEEYNSELSKVAKDLFYAILVYCTELNYTVDKFIFGLEMGTASGGLARLDMYMESDALYEGVRLNNGELEYLLLM